MRRKSILVIVLLVSIFVGAAEACPMAHKMIQHQEYMKFTYEQLMAAMAQETEIDPRKTMVYLETLDALQARMLGLQRSIEHTCRPRGPGQ